MPFEQARDVIEKARSFHRDLAAFYHRIGGVVDRERVQLLLEYLGEHEERRERQLAEFERRTPATMLDTWYQFPPETRIQEALQRIHIRPDMSVAEAVCMALQLDESLLRLYRQAADSAPIEHIRETFLRLYEEGKKERSKLVGDLFEPE